MLTVITMWIKPSCSRQLCCLTLLWQGLHASPLFSGCLTRLCLLPLVGHTFRPPELEFVTIDRTAWVSFLFLFYLTESETTDSVPSDEENAEVSAFWIFSSLDQGLKIQALRYFCPFSTAALSTSGIFILVIARGEKQTRKVQGIQTFGWLSQN